MRKTIIVLVFINLIAGSVFSDEIQDTQINRQAAAERYLSAVPMEKTIKDYTDKMAENLPVDPRKMFIEVMSDHVSVADIEQIAISSLVRHFTVKELNALADFYGSPEGQSAMKKYGAYMADVLPIIEKIWRKHYLNTGVRNNFGD